MKTKVAAAIFKQLVIHKLTVKQRIPQDELVYTENQEAVFEKHRDAMTLKFAEGLKKKTRLEVNQTRTEIDGFGTNIIASVYVFTEEQLLGLIETLEEEINNEMNPISWGNQDV